MRLCCDAELPAWLRKFSTDRPPWGWRRAATMARRAGWTVNNKRIRRLWRPLSIGPGHPAADINHLAHGCEIRPLVVVELATDEAPVFRIWVRPRAGSVDELFALMCGDISLPVPYAVGRRGWAPTVQLTAYLRAFPADGWLRVQTRRLALVPAG